MWARLEFTKSLGAYAYITIRLFVKDLISVAVHFSGREPLLVVVGAKRYKTTTTIKLGLEVVKKP